MLFGQLIVLVMEGKLIDCIKLFSKKSWLFSYVTLQFDVCYVAAAYEIWFH